MSRLNLLLLLWACVATASTVIAALADNDARQKIERLHVHEIQTCLLNENAPAECDKEWLRALYP